MSSDEQNDLITRLADYIEQQLPSLVVKGVHYDATLIASFKDGMDILSHFPKSFPFYRDCSRMVNGYERQAARLEFLLNLVKRDISHELPSANNVIVLPQSASLRRGRPTDKESAQRAADKQLASRAAAISRLTGRKVMKQEAAPIDTSRPTDTSRRKKDSEPNLFDSAIDAATSPSESLTDVSCDQSQDNPDDHTLSLSALRSWLFLLPDSLQSDVKSIKDLRAERAACAERAKMLFEQGEKESEIAVHTSRAKQINEKLRDIFDAVDRQLALAYVMLNEVNPEYGRWASKYEKRGGIESLLSDLLPYYKKVTSSTTPVSCDQSQALTPSQHLLQKAQRLNSQSLRDPEKEKEIHKIKAYFTRKDCASTPERLSKLRAYKSRAQELGVDADTLSAFDVIIDKVSSYVSCD